VAQPPRLLQLDPQMLWFSAAGAPPTAESASRRKVERSDVPSALAQVGPTARYNQLREQIMQRSECSKRTAQRAIADACQQGWIVQDNGCYRLPLQS
jgi:hypothetical protein